MIKLNFETLTPLHISNGNQLAYNLEYVVIDNEFAKLNSRAHKRLAENNLFDFHKNYKFYELIKLIEKNKNIFDETCFDYKIDTAEAFEKFLNNERRDGRKIVQEFINTNGNFYVPGSSVKGMLTTILARNPRTNPLGINPKNPTIADKFVITDSDFISAENFIVDVAQRPPSINLIVLDAGRKFTCQIRSKGNLNVEELRKKLESYSFLQLQKAKAKVKHFKNIERKPGGATNYYNFIERLSESLNLAKDEYLVNLGFGAGSYYKLFENAPIPKFKNPGRNWKKEEAHTTFMVDIENKLYQLGWCKLTIEEE